MISKLCQSQDWWITSLLSYSQPALNVATLPKSSCDTLSPFSLYLPGLEIVLCLWSAVYRDQREGWAGCWAGLAAGVWLNNSGYWQSGAGLLTSPIPADDPHTELSISLFHEDSASFRREYILPHLVGQSFSIWPWQGHIQNGSHPTPQGLCTNEAELN